MGQRLWPNMGRYYKCKLLLNLIKTLNTSLYQMSYLPLTIPEVIIAYIYTYIPIHTKMNLNITNFTTYYPRVIDKIFKKKYSTYIMDIIRNGRTLSLSLMLRDRYDFLIKVKKWRYKNYTFPNFIRFIKFLCIKYEKQQCLQILLLYEKERGIYDKKRHKKIKIKSIRWNN